MVFSESSFSFSVILMISFAANLKPAHPKKLADEICILVGGAETLAGHALALAQKGDLTLAAHFSEFAFLSKPTSEMVLKTRITVYSALQQNQKSLMSSGIYGSVVAETRELLSRSKL